jgi:CTP synthase
VGCPNFIWNDCPGATSAEFDDRAEHPVVIFMPEISKTHMGGTMRLGLRPTVFTASSEEWSKTRKLYGGAGKVWERHRHRYEVNPEYIDRLEKGGLEFVGQDEKGQRMQWLELRGTSSLYVFVGSWTSLEPSRSAF